MAPARIRFTNAPSLIYRVELRRWPIKNKRGKAQGRGREEARAGSRAMYLQTHRP